MIGIPFFAKNRPRLITTGGTITTLAWDKIHTFTTNGTFTCVGAGYIQLLVVGGGQGGYFGNAAAGSNSGSGGNGAEVKSYTIFKVDSGSYTIVIGSGSSGGLYASGTYPLAGGNSTAFGITARGGQYNTIGTNGAGGVSGISNGYGGAIGTTSSISGALYVYASSGGSGACQNNDTNYTLTGGSGGTGAGTGGGIKNWGQEMTPAATAGSNYGAGGGGGSKNSVFSKGSNGGNGKAGVVIIRFRRI